jgi:hypothetical protein
LDLFRLREGGLAVVRPSDRTLRKIYDKQFMDTADIEDSKPGQPHSAGLRAVYERGRADSEKEERKRAKHD